MIRQLNSTCGEISPHVLEMPWGTIAGAAIGAIGSLIGGSRNNSAVANLNKTNRDWQERQSRIAYERQLAMMDKQNDYNSFSNQRKLAEEAGLNPNLIFGNGGAAGISTSTGSTSAPQTGSPSQFAPQNPFSPEIAGVLSQVALNNANAEKVRAETEKIDTETIGTQITNDFNRLELTLNKDFSRLERQFNLENVDAQRALADAKRRVESSQLSLNLDELTRMRPAEASRVWSTTTMNQTQSRLNEILAVKNETERGVMLRQLALNIAVGNSVIAKNYADASYQRTMDKAWQFGGVMYSGQSLSNSLRQLDYNKAKQFYEATNDDYIKNVKSLLQKQTNFNQRRNLVDLKTWHDVDGILHNAGTWFFNTLDEVGNVWHGSTSVNASDFMQRSPVQDRLFPASK